MKDVNISHKITFRVQEQVSMEIMVGKGVYSDFWYTNYHAYSGISFTNYTWLLCLQSPEKT